MPFKNPERARQYQREYRRMQRNGQCTTPSTTPLPVEFRLQCARDVIDLLEGQVKALLVEENISTAERARCIGYLAGICLRAIEAGDLTVRIEELETILKQRGGAKHK